MITVPASDQILGGSGQPSPW